ncbi:MAG: septum formation initiator family protein [candidate division Zixibacteria bacterium]|nr:septum formation initiator family protein [candidate division Zixibacteria bacterium]
MAEEKLTKKVTRQLIGRLAEFEHGVKRKTKSILIGFGALYLIYLFCAGDYGLFRIHRLIDQRDILEDNYLQTVTEAADFKYRLRRLESDPHFIEYLARTRFGYSRSGETIYHMKFKSH